MAQMYLKLDDEAKMLYSLEKSVEHAVKFDTQVDGMYTAFMVNKVTRYANDAVKSDTYNQCGLLLKFVKEGAYTHLQDHPRMQKIIEKLRAVAIM